MRGAADGGRPDYTIDVFGGGEGRRGAMRRNQR